MNKKLTIIGLSLLSLLFVSSYIIAGDRENIVATSTPRMAIDNEAVSSLSFNNAEYITTSNVGSYAIMTTHARVKVNDFIAGMHRIWENDNSSNDVFAVGYTLFPGNWVVGSWLNSGKKATLNKWIDVILVQNGTSNKIYVDGTLIFSGTNTAVIDGTGTLTIGNFSGHNEGLRGKIKSFRRWNRVLTGNEMTAITYNNIYPRTNLTIEYNLNEATGTTVYDTSGNGNNGTITGATWSTDVPSKARATSTPRQVVVDDKASLLFDGSSDVTKNSTLPFTGTDGFSISALIKPGVKTGDHQTIVNVGGVLDGVALSLSASGGGGGGGYFLTCNYSGVAFKSTTFELQPGNWYQVGIVKDTTLQFYINGVAEGSGISGTPNTPTTGWSVGAIYSGGRGFSGNIKNTLIYDRVLTANEMSNIYLNNIIPTNNLSLYLPLNEGAGATTYDTSGNSNNGTITGATWSSDTPSKKRKAVNGNLIENGDFEFAPPFVASTTGSGKWIDGSEAGSATNNLQGWAILTGTTAGSWSAKFDSSIKYNGNYSMKLSTREISSALDVSPPQTLSAENNKAYAITISPSTSYTYSFWMKTNYVSGDSTIATRLNFNERDANNGGSVSNYSTAVKITTDWTKYTGTFTTNANSRIVIPRLTLKGNDGAGTLIMDAWFDDIALKKTSDL